MLASLDVMSLTILRLLFCVPHHGRGELFHNFAVLSEPDRSLASADRFNATFSYARLSVHPNEVESSGGSKNTFLGNERVPNRLIGGEASRPQPN